MEALIMTGQILLSLSILVGLHEMGHLLAAKKFKMRVEQFSIGFPPKLFGFKYKDTEYNLSAIPLGGFVKISGMVDESLDTKTLNEPPKDYEFRAKPAWQRLIVMLGGIIVNVVTGVIIFIMLTWLVGETYLSKDEVNNGGGIAAYELAEGIGLRTGDKIIKVNGREFENFAQIMNPDVLLSNNAYYTVERNGEILDVPIPGNFIENFNDPDLTGKFLEPRIQARVARVAPESFAERVGMKEDDAIIEIDGKEVYYFDEVYKVVTTYQKDHMSLKVQRGDEVLAFDGDFSQDSILGFNPAPAEYALATVDYNLGEATVTGTQKAFGIVFVQLKAFGKMFSGELSFQKSISGPIGIAQAYGGTWDWQRFWFMTGLLSMVLAFMNLLPIPALDGGHVVFITYEMIAGRKPSDKFLENAQKVGMVFLLALMVFVIGNDIFKAFF